MVYVIIGSLVSLLSILIVLGLQSSRKNPKRPAAQSSDVEELQALETRLEELKSEKKEFEELVEKLEFNLKNYQRLKAEYRYLDKLQTDRMDEKANVATAEYKIEEIKSGQKAGKSTSGDKIAQLKLKIRQANNKIAQLDEKIMQTMLDIQRKQSVD